MTKKQPPTITYKGRSLGIAVLTAAQIFIGVIHVFFGFLLLAFENLNFIQATIAYDFYTIIFWGLNSGFRRSYLAGQEGRVGWHDCGFIVCYCRRFFDAS
jgi:hypothetical protein